MKCLVLFVSAALFFGVLILGGGYYIWGTETLVQGSAAFVLTFVPAAGTLAWVIYSFHSAPEMMLLASLAGSGVRMAIALGGALLLTVSEPQTFNKPFLLWLIFFYLVFLGLEITLLVRQQPKPNGSSQT